MVNEADGLAVPGHRLALARSQLSRYQVAAGDRRISPAAGPGRAWRRPILLLPEDGQASVTLGCMNDTATALLSILGSWLTNGALLWLGRTWISERLKQSIANEYAVAFERHKADLERANAADLERVKASYADQRAIRALGEDSFREAMRVSHTKRVEAIQIIWDAINRVSEGLPPVMTYVDVLPEKDLPDLLTSKRGRAALDALRTSSWTSF